jgi:hypothetical protein
MNQEPLEELKDLAHLTGLSYKTLVNLRTLRKLEFPVYAMPPGSRHPKLCARRSDILKWVEMGRQEPQAETIERLF